VYPEHERARDLRDPADLSRAQPAGSHGPAFAPGTGTPEIGGLTSWQAQAILRQLRGLAFRGMDVVEVAPPYDVAEITALAGATIASEYLGLLGTAIEAERIILSV
jgi:hypothetical protein